MSEYQAISCLLFRTIWPNASRNSFFPACVSRPFAIHSVDDSQNSAWSFSIIAIISRSTTSRSKISKQGRLSRLIRDALIARKSHITSSLRRNLAQWSSIHHPFCYLCGVALDFNSATKPDRFTLDHIWPNCYGGDSDKENLLPCCDSCNSGKKEDYTSWAACDIQAFVISRDPSENELTHISGRMRFAMHNRAVRAYAKKRNVSMRDAYLRLGPWLTKPWHLDDDVGDFFNLANYEPDRCSPYNDQLLRLP